jgi:iron complex transport system substrate-binding protein
MRICSLLPSATEIVASLGPTDSLVAVSEECDWPAHVRELPRRNRLARRHEPAPSLEIELDRPSWH